MAEKPHYIENEEKVRQFWKDSETFEKSVQKKHQTVTIVFMMVRLLQLELLTMGI